MEERKELQERVINAPYQETFNAVRQVFLMRGFVVRELNLETGLIDTDYKYSTGTGLKDLFFGKTRSKVTATITKIDESHTKVWLNLTAERKSELEEWERFTDKEIGKKPYDEYFDMVSKEVGGP